MNPRALIKAAEQVIRQNSPAILAGLGATGVVVTAYFAHHAGFRSGYKSAINDEAGHSRGSWKDHVREDWKIYIPPVVAGAVSIGCIIGAVKIGNRRTAAITAAYSLSEKAFEEYRTKVTEKMGERKEQNVRDEIAQERVASGAPSRDIILMGGGDVLCCDLRTDRYFLSSVERLKKAQNDVNFRVLQDGYAYLSDFYSMIDVYLPKESTYGYHMGWSKEKGSMELTFSTILADDTRPCVTINYNYLDPL
jgi:hypothetical protein